MIPALLALGLCLATASRASAHIALDEQVSDLDARIAADPRNAGLYIRRGELHRFRAGLLPALRDFESARALQPGSAEPDFHAGRALLEAGLPVEAMHALDGALALQPGHLEARIARGRALARLERPLDAAADFTRALEGYPASTPPQPDLYLQRATALASAGPEHVEQALGGLDEGIQRLGPAVSLQLAAIDLEARLGRYDAALDRLDVVAANRGIQGQWLARRGEILLAAGRPLPARLAFEAALESIASLPASRRSAGAVAALEASVRETLARLDRDRAGRKADR